MLHRYPPSATSLDTRLATARRQFLTVPIGGLPSGRYEISLRVRDQTNGAVAGAATTFERR